MTGGFADERVMLAALSASQGDVVVSLLRSAQFARLSAAEARHSLASILTGVAALMRRRCSGQCAGRALEEATCLLDSAAAVQRLSAQKATDLSALVKRLGEEVMPALLAGRPIAFSADVQPVLLTPHAAGCIGMALCELILNAADHAFVGGRGGTITVRSLAARGSLLIEVMDDGVGMQRGQPARPDRGLGLRMVRQVVRKQLGGSFAMRARPSGPGTVARMRIPGRLVQEGGALAGYFPGVKGERQWNSCVY